MPDPLAIAGGVVAVIGALGAIGMAARWVRRRWRVAEDFFDDWRGELARPGVPARLGVPERLSLIEAELRPNHGGSLRDAVDRVEKRLDDHLTEHARGTFTTDT